ncbi:hypothetical protein BDN70DRAFT_851479 [Pholiota conissans]|uniref:F-box domain-containing protein n=1 Tax=Pholiota conissans TaxID=109636 RepID=A0A9P5Z8W0_9AGAR|nr:hypothetical protein BDN70DRAFT_851479 [Pholiota conissans]
MTFIYTVHPEILSIIFENTKAMTADETQFPGEVSAEKKHGIAFEVIACAVCTYFREVAFATPSLWTTTRVHGASDPENIVQRLSHAGNFWLDIRIDLAAKDDQMDAAKLQLIIDSILQHSLRWRSLCIGYGYERRDHPVVGQICSAPAPGLKRLSLTVDDVDKADGTLINRAANLPHIFKDGTPELELIRLRGFSIHLFRPPLSSMVTLHLDQTRSIHIQYSTLADMLTASPHLANLSIHSDILAQGNWPDRQKAIRLPALRSLRLFSNSGEGFPGMLKIINAPRLEFLTLKGLREGDMELVWAMQKTRFDGLKSLSLVDSDMSTWMCVRMFETFRQITSLSAVYASAGKMEGMVLNHLSHGKTSGQDGVQFVPWPKLTTVCLGSDLWVNGREVTRAFIAARREDGHPISTVIFKGSAEQMEDILSARTEAGVGVEIKFCSQNIIWPEKSSDVDQEDTLFR